MPVAEATISGHGVHWRFEAIGTVWDIETASELPEDVRARVAKRIDAFDSQWSRFREDSVVSALARSGGAVPAPPDARAMLDAYTTLSDATDGAVNPLVGDSLARLGYGADYSFVAADPRPAPKQWRSRVLWDDGTVTLTEPATIDVGALGKGRLVDIVLAELEEVVPGRIVVDAGGDLAVRGGPVRVGLEHPYDPRRAIGVVEIANGALCASAVNRRAWGDGLHHVIDARTGLPVRRIAATWAFAPNAMRADAVATALFFDGGPQLAHAWGVEWVRMFTDGRAEYSPRSPARLFRAES